MVTLNRIYTRAGDGGTTRLATGATVSKSDLRVEAYGAVDEANACLGLARAGGPEPELDALLARLQNELFDLGSELATPRESFYEGMFRVGAAEVTALETLMDECQKELAPLKSFVLPGGGPVGGFLHQARTVCRRAERGVLALSRVEDVGEWPLKYVNRLSDLFFVLSRWVGKHLGETEYLWERGLASHARKR